MSPFLPPRRIFVSTPLRPAPSDPDPGANIRFAKEICRKVAEAGGDPEAPHLTFTAFLRDEVEAERNLGISLGLLRLKTCDESWVVLPSWRAKLSMGMADEKDAALANGIPVQLITEPADLEMHLARLREGRIPLRLSTFPPPPIS